MALGQQGFARALDESNRRFINNYYDIGQRQRANVGYGDDPDRQPGVRTYNSASRNEMVARFDGQCRLPNCGNRKITANVTVIAKVNGQWNHKECPVADPVFDAMNDDDRAMAAAEMAADRAGTVRDSQDEQDAIEAALDQYHAAQRKSLVLRRKAIYRVSLSGSESRYETDHINLQLVPSERYGSVKIAERHGDSIGRIDRNGQIRLWDGVDANASRTKAILAALDVVLNDADPIRFAKAYAVESVCCMRCGDDLVEPESRARLLGPTCVLKWEA